MLAITEWVCSAGSRLREVWCRKVCDYRLLIARPNHATGRWVLHPCFGGVAFEPVERAPDCTVVRLDDAVVAADQGGERDGLRRGEGEIATGTVADFAVADPAAEPPPGTVRHLARQHGLEDVGLDRAFETEFGGALARPGARRPVLGRVLGVIPVAFIVARALGRAGNRTDRSDHQIQRP